MVINEITGVPGAGKSFVARKLADNKDVVIGNESLYLSYYFNFPLSRLPCSMSKVVMVLLSLKVFLCVLFCNYRAISFSLIKISYNISYKITLKRVLIKVARNSVDNKILLVDEGPYHLPFNYLGISIPHALQDLGYLGYRVKLILVESVRSTLVTRLAERGHWRVENDGWSDFIDENLTIYKRNRALIFDLADKGVLDFDVIEN